MVSFMKSGSPSFRRNARLGISELTTVMLSIIDNGGNTIQQVSVESVYHLVDRRSSLCLGYANANALPTIDSSSTPLLTLVRVIRTKSSVGSFEESSVPDPGFERSRAHHISFTQHSWTSSSSSTTSSGVSIVCHLYSQTGFEANSGLDST